MWFFLGAGMSSKFANNFSDLFLAKKLMSLLYFLKDLKKIKFNYKLGSKTWFGTGGNAQYFLIINSLKSLEYLLKIIPRSIPVFLIGAGSNILVRDGGIKGVTIKLGEEFKKIIFDRKKKF